MRLRALRQQLLEVLHLVLQFSDPPSLCPEDRPASEERRRDMVKVAKTKGEDAKVSIRNVRRKANEELHRISKDGEAGEDEVVRAEKELQHVTDKYVAQVDELVKNERLVWEMGGKSFKSVSERTKLLALPSSVQSRLRL